MSDNAHVETTPQDEDTAATVAALEALGGGVNEAGDFEPGPDAGPVATGSGGGIPDEQIEDMAAVCVGMASDMISQAHPALPAVYDAATREKLAQALAPVLKKYDGAIPEWLAPWVPEIMLGCAVVTVGVSTMQAVKNYVPPEGDADGTES